MLAARKAQKEGQAAPAEKETTKQTAGSGNDRPKI
jgi:hypothetical protein